MKRKVFSLMLALCMVLGMIASASAENAGSEGTKSPSTPGTTVTDNDPHEPEEEPDSTPVQTHQPQQPQQPQRPTQPQQPTQPQAPVEVPASDIKVSAVQDAASLPAEEAAVLTAATEAITSAKSTSEFISKAGVTSAVQNALASINQTAAAPVSIEDLTPAATFSISSAGAAAEVIANGGTVELSFEVDGIADGDAVVVLVFDGANWNVVPAVVRNGKVVGQFNTLGTVVVMKADDQAASDYVTSPQTSGTNLESALICGAVLSMAVLALCIKRSRMA